MKKLALAAVVSIAATSAFAGGMEEPIVEMPVVVEEDAATTGTGWVVPLLVIAVLAAAAS
jgi:hypothetical protein